MLKTGKLPLKNMASIAFNELTVQAQTLKALLAKEGLDVEFTQVDIELQLGDTLVTGTIPLVHQQAMVMISFSTFDIKYYLRAYILYLAGVAAGKLKDIYFVTGKYEAVYKGVGISKEDAQSRLLELIDIFREGHQRIIPFYAELSVAPNTVLKMNWESFTDLMKEKIEDYKFPLDDHYVLNEVQREWFKKQETGEEFMRLCGLLITPLKALFPTAKFNGK
jgi:exodeoxyribonuclease V gamma subunit